MAKRVVSLVMAMIILLTFTVPAMAGSCKWAPYKGSTSVDKNATTQYFMFKKTAIDFLAKIKNCTYEHETQVYDTKYVNFFRDYLRRSYWTSNLPNVYLDTQLLDCWPFASGSVDNFAVGTSAAGKMSSEKWYYYTIALVGEKATKATIRIKGQRGHPKVPFVANAYSVFADETSDTLFQFNAPLRFSTWSY